MKKVIVFNFYMLVFLMANSQAPMGMSYQSVIRDANGELLREANIGVRISIFQESITQGPEVFIETHTVFSNPNGLVTLIIGSGNPISGSLSTIDWSSGPFFIQTGIDPDGGGNYSIYASSQLLSVPYAFFAEETKKEMPTGSAYGEILFWNGNSWNTLAIGEENQVLTVKEGQLRWDNINFFGGETGTVTDIDGNVYETIMIGQQVWMSENLKTTNYRNGQPIPKVINYATWAGTTAGAYNVYDHTMPRAEGIDTDEEMIAAYGLLYNWYAVNHSNGLCPAGWHVPTDGEWTQLTNFISGRMSLGGNQLKSCRQINTPIGEDCDTEIHPRWVFNEFHYGTDDYGFNALPGGARSSDGTYYWIGNAGRWWTATQYSSSNAYRRGLIEESAAVQRTHNAKKYGFSVRCIKDN